MQRLGGSLWLSFETSKFRKESLTEIASRDHDFRHMISTDEELLKLAADGSKHALGILFTRYQASILRMITARMDPRIISRVDAMDVIQEVHVEVECRLHEYLQNPGVSFSRWMRFLAKQKLVEILRRHVFTQARDVRREVPLTNDPSAEESFSLAGYLLGNAQSPSSIMAKAEVKIRVNSAIEKLDPDDREILLLRHVERLRTTDASIRLGISPNTCRQRHHRALKQLRTLLIESDLSWGDL